MLARMRGLLILLIMALLPAPPALAQGGGFHLPFYDLLFGNRNAPPPPPQPAEKRAPRPYVPRKRETHAVPLPPTPVNPATPDAPPVEAQAARTLLIIGDSLGLQLGQGLREAFSNIPALNLVNRAKADTGLVNTSERDWVKYVRELLAAPDPVNLAVMMIGANDNQPLRDDAGQVQEPLSEPWRAIYVKRIDDILEAFRERRIPLVWVGMPVMKSDKLTGRMLAFNDIVRERVQRAGLTYIDVWEAFADDAGHYAPNGPDVAGQMVKIRAGDGVHFTSAGARKLAFFVEREVKKMWPDQPSAPVVASVPPAASVPATLDINQQILRDLQPPAEPPAIQVPLPDFLPIPIIPSRPVAGPVLMLTAPPVAKDGALARGPAAIVDPNAWSDVTAALERGRATRPKPGRADDFGWLER